MAELTEIASCEDVVDYILNNKSNISYDQQLVLKDIPRPTPKMTSLFSTCAKQNRGFSENNYHRSIWLTASTIRNRLYCWKCIMFSSDKTSVWGNIGYNNMQNLSRAIERHVKSQEHIFSCIQFEMLGKENNVVKPDHKREIEKFNENVRENREVLRKLIDVIIFLCSQEIPFRAHDASEDPERKENFKGIVEFLKKYDSKLNDFLINAKAFSDSVENDLIESVNHVLTNNIYEEIKSSDFFSWQIDESTEASCKSQLSVVFRYICNGEVVERFVGFCEANPRRDAESLFKVLTENFAQFHLANKLVAQSYDGAAVASGQLHNLQSKIKEIAPQAALLHSYAHKLTVILSKACYGIKEVRIFFSNISGFPSFFLKSSDISHVLDTVAPRRFRSIAPACWNLLSTVIYTIDDNKEKLIEVFEYISASQDFLNDKVTLREAYGLKQMLLDTDFIFLLKVFRTIFEQADHSFEILENKATNINCSKKTIEKLLSKLNEFKNNEDLFNSLHRDSNADSNNYEPSVKMIKLTFSKTYCKNIFCEILDTIIGEIKIRFADLNVLQYFDLVNIGKLPNFSQEFPSALLSKLKERYKFFDDQLLKHELSLYYHDHSILGGSQSPQEMLSYIFSNNLICCLPEMYKLLSLILTFPATLGSIELPFSALKRIQAFTRNTSNQDRLLNIAIMSIEKDYLSKLKDSDSFYNNIIDHLANTKYRMLLSYVMFT